jgi:DNA-binding transcriptional MerR regulator
MKIGDLEKKFGVSGTSIRRWIESFSDFLSDESQKIDLRQRRFTEQDYIILATINYLSKKGEAFANIREKLEGGFRVDDGTIASLGYSDGRMVPAVVVEQVIDSTEVRMQLERVSAERDKLLDMLENAQREIKEIRHEKEGQIQVLQQEIKELQRALGKMEGKLEEIYENRKPRD